MLALDGVVGLDLGIPAQVFGAARDRRPDAALRGRRLHPGRPAGAQHAPASRCCPTTAWSCSTTADTVIVPGIHGGAAADRRHRRPGGRRGAARRARRAAPGSCRSAPARSCSPPPGCSTAARPPPTGPTPTGSAGCYPQVDLDPDVLFVDDGDVLTSAGVAAGIDLCLHVIRTRPRQRGGQPGGPPLRGAAVAGRRPGPVHRAAGARAAADTGTAADPGVGAGSGWTSRSTCDDLAAHARMSVRTFTRRFREETGLSPAPVAAPAARRPRPAAAGDHRPERRPGRPPRGFGTAAPPCRPFPPTARAPRRHRAATAGTFAPEPLRTAASARLRTARLRGHASGGPHAHAAPPPAGRPAGRPGGRSGGSATRSRRSGASWARCMGRWTRACRSRVRAPGQRLVDDQVEALAQVGLDRGVAPPGRAGRPARRASGWWPGSRVARPSSPPHAATSASSCGRWMRLQVVVGERRPGQHRLGRLAHQLVVGGQVRDDLLGAQLPLRRPARTRPRPPPRAARRPAATPRSPCPQSTPPTASIGELWRPVHPDRASTTTSADRGRVSGGRGGRGGSRRPRTGRGPRRRA